MNKSTTAIIVTALLALMSLPSLALSTVLTSDTTWSGEVLVDQDILVPAGVTLTIAPGAVIRLSAAESTKTDPEYLSPLTEITVRGALIAAGSKDLPVTFLPAGDKRSSWAGIIIDGGRADLRFAVVSDAENGATVMSGSLSLSDSLLTRNRYGLTVQGGGAAVRVTATTVTDNEYGVVLLNGATIESRKTIVQKNRKKDIHTASSKGHAPAEKGYKASSEKKNKSLTYGDEALLGTVVWQGRIEVNGIVRVPVNSRLIIVPGTVVEFRKKDTNHDNIGENGILIQGVIIAKGTPEDPIILRSAEKQRSMGDWDSINIMNSDQAQNLLEFVQIEDAYRGLHFHFSRVTVSEAVIRNNYRGVQFQESVVDIRGTHFYRNKSAFQARDSEILFSGNLIHNNYTGMNVFRNSISLHDNTVRDSLQEGVRVREGLAQVERNLIDGNRYGLLVQDALYGTFSANVISHNLESGISLRGTDNIEISGNAVQQNGLNGMNIQDAGALIRGNLITDNRERGIGVQSFHGAITENNILRNGLYNLGIDGAADVSARSNWWGGGDVRKTLYDKENDPAKGRIDYLPKREGPVLFAWPLRSIRSDTSWQGDIAIKETVTVDPGAHLVILPGTRVLFAKGTGLVVRGRISARGEAEKVIAFASLAGTDAGEWDEILIDHAPGSVFAHAAFEYATWALHSHFTDLKVEGCSFRNNSGGLRFTSGPIEIRHSRFTENDIAIRAFRGKALIRENSITRNRVGIFVREKGGGLTIKKNNLFANTEYNVRMGDFNDEDVDARENWWGDLAPGTKIYDARSEPGIGTVRYEPFAKKPFPTESR
jgi:parallel beta-helix repeat protein